MTMLATTHLNFRGNARAALDFYAHAFDGQVTIVTNREGGRTAPASEAGQVIWGQVTNAGGLRVMAFDVPASRPFHPGENAVFVVVAGSASDITPAWDKLGAGATILEPLAPSQWAPLYGMLKDRFGITWVLSVPGQAAQV